MGQQCVRGLFGGHGSGADAASQYERVGKEGVSADEEGLTTLDRVTGRIDRTMKLLDQRASHLEKESIRKRRHALALRRQGDQRRARLVFLESRYMEHSIETLFGLMGNLQVLKYQVQQTRLVSDALKTMSEYMAISQQLREMERKFDVEKLMDTIREDSERLADMEDVLTESLLPAEQEDAIDRELAALEEREAKVALEETLIRDDWSKTGDLVSERRRKGSTSNSISDRLLASLNGLFAEETENKGDEQKNAKQMGEEKREQKISASSPTYKKTKNLVPAQ